MNGRRGARALLVVAVLGLAACGTPDPSAAPSSPSPGAPLQADFIASWGEVGTDSLFNGPAGVAADGEALYVADTRNHRIVKVPAGGRPPVSWTTAGGRPLRSPTGLALDRAGNLYVADTGHHRIVKFSPNGDPLAIWGSPGGAEGNFNAPAGIAVDRAGVVYVADSKNHRVQKLSPTGTPLGGWGGYGSGEGQFNSPSGIAVDRAGRVFVADTWNHRIQVFDRNGRFQFAWGTLGRGSGFFNTPMGVAADPRAGLYVLTAGQQVISTRETADLLRAQKVQRFTPGGRFQDFWGRAGGGPGEFDRASAIALDGDGNVYVADTENHRVQKFSPAGRFLRQWGALPAGVVKRPGALAVDGRGGLYVADPGNHRIVRFDRTGAFVSAWRIRPTSTIEDITVTANGTLYAALTDAGKSVVQRLTPDGSEADVVVRGAPLVKGVAVDRRGSLFVSHWQAGVVRQYGTPGDPIASWTVEFPGDVAVDGTGHVHVVDLGRHRVVQLGPNGRIRRSWGSLGSGAGQFQDARIAVDDAGRIFLADILYHRIQVFGPRGLFLGAWGRWGGAAGEFSQPRGIAVDAAGTVYVADTLNDRVQVFRVRLPDRNGDR